MAALCSLLDEEDVTVPLNRRYESLSRGCICAKIISYLCTYFLKDVLEAKELVVQLVNCRLYMMGDLVNVSWNPKALEYSVDGSTLLMGFMEFRRKAR